MSPKDIKQQGTNEFDSISLYLLSFPSFYYLLIELFKTKQQKGLCSALKSKKNQEKNADISGITKNY
jgi:hypothetical protein